MISIRNILLKNEIKKENVIRKNYIKRTVVEIAKSIKRNEYTWITYDEFKEKENKIINTINNNLDINAVEELISQLIILGYYLKIHIKKKIQCN